MKIKSINPENVKGNTSPVSLSEMNLIVGDNFSGKTAYLDTLRLAILGRHPLLGATNKELFGLCSGVQMGATCTLDDGTETGRTYRMEKKSVKCEEINPIDIDVATEIMLDPSLFFNKSDNEKLNTILTIIGFSEDWTKEKIIAEFKRVRIAEPSEETEKELARYIENIDGHFGEDISVSLAMANVEEYLKQEQKDSRAYQKRMLQTAQGLSDMKFVEEEMERLPNIEILNQDIKEMSEKRDELRDKISRHEQTKEMRDKAMAEKDRLSSMTDRDYDAEIKNAEQELAGITTKINEAQAALDKAESELKDANEKHESYYHAFCDEEEKLKDSVETMSFRLMQMREEAEGSWKKITDEQPEPESRVQVECTAQFDENSVFKIEMDNLRWKLIESEQAKLEYKGLIDKHREKSDQLHFLRTQWASQNSKHESETLPIRTRRDSMIADVNYLKTQEAAKINTIQSAKEMLGMVESHRKQLASISIPEYDGETHTRLVEELNGLAAQIEGKKSTRAKLEGLKQDHKRIEQAENEKRVFDGTLELLKGLIQKVKDMKEQIVDDSIQRVLKPANELIDGIMGSPLVYEEGRLGRTSKSGKFINYKTFSGSELAMTFCAITIGLAAKNKKLAIMDELSYFDDQRKAQLLKNIQGMIERGTIEQFIGVDVRVPENIPEGFKLIKTQEQ